MQSHRTSEMKIKWLIVLGKYLEICVALTVQIRSWAIETSYYLGLHLGPHNFKKKKRKEKNMNCLLKHSSSTVVFPL